MGHMTPRKAWVLALVAVGTACATPELGLRVDGSPSCAPGVDAPLCTGPNGCRLPLDGPPVYVAIDAAPADAAVAEPIRHGVLIAIGEVNVAGGLLRRRPLLLVEPEELARMTSVEEDDLEDDERARLAGLVAVFHGRTGPTPPEVLARAEALGVPLLDPRGAAGERAVSDRLSGSLFSLSPRDEWAIPLMLGHARTLGARRVGLLVRDSDLGREGLAVAERLDAADPNFRVVATQWLGADAASIEGPYRALRDAGAQAVVLIGGAREARMVVEGVAALPAIERLPIIGDWRAAEAGLGQVASTVLRKVEFSMVQTYSLAGAGDEAARRVAAVHDELFKTSGVRTIEAPAGIAQAYDLTHILARAVAAAGSTDRAAVRGALEQLGPYAGLIRTYAPPFAPDRHQALGPEQLFMAEYAPDGAIEPIRNPRRRAVED